MLAILFRPHKKTLFHAEDSRVLDVGLVIYINIFTMIYSVFMPMWIYFPLSMTNIGLAKSVVNCLIHGLVGVRIRSVLF